MYFSLFWGQSKMLVRLCLKETDSIFSFFILAISPNFLVSPSLTYISSLSLYVKYSNCKLENHSGMGIVLLFPNLSLLVFSIITRFVKHKNLLRFFYSPILLIDKVTAYLPDLLYCLQLSKQMY